MGASLWLDVKSDAPTRREVCSQNANASPRVTVRLHTNSAAATVRLDRYNQHSPSNSPDPDELHN